MRIASSRGRRKGVVGLLTVVMIGAIMLSAGIVIAFIAQTQVVLSGDVDGEHVARMLAASCVEEAVYRIKRNSSYAGGTVPLGSDSCAVTVSGVGNSRTLEVTAVYGDFTKRLSVALTRKNNAPNDAVGWSIVSWTENGPP